MDETEDFRHQCCPDLWNWGYHSLKVAPWKPWLTFLPSGRVAHRSVLITWRINGLDLVPACGKLMLCYSVCSSSLYWGCFIKTVIEAAQFKYGNLQRLEIPNSNMSHLLCPLTFRRRLRAALESSYRAKQHTMDIKVVMRPISCKNSYTKRLCFQILHKLAGSSYGWRVSSSH